MMTEATEPELRLAKAFLGMVREARNSSPSAEAGAEFGNALFECPDGMAKVAELLPDLCAEDEWPDILLAIEAMKGMLKSQ